MHVCVSVEFSESILWFSPCCMCLVLVTCVSFFFFFFFVLCLFSVGLVLNNCLENSLTLCFKFFILQKKLGYHNIYVI